MGRGGSFRYNNSDHSIEMGLLLARRLLGDDVDYDSVNTESEYQEEIHENEAERDRFTIDDDEQEAESPRRAAPGE